MNTGLEMDSMASAVQTGSFSTGARHFDCWLGHLYPGEQTVDVGRGQHELCGRAIELLEEAEALGRGTVEIGHVWPLKMDTGALPDWLKAASGGGNV